MYISQPNFEDYSAIIYSGIAHSGNYGSNYSNSYHIRHNDYSGNGKNDLDESSAKTSNSSRCSRNCAVCTGCMDFL